MAIIDDLDEFIANPGKRTAADYFAFFKAVADRIVGIPRVWAGRAGEILRVRPDGTGLGLEGPFDFKGELVRGGLITTLVADPGPLTIAASLTGVTLESQSETDVTWTLSAIAPKGTILGWSQMGNGKITFAVAAGGRLSNADDHTKSGGVETWGTLQVIKIEDSKSVWGFTGTGTSV